MVAPVEFTTKASRWVRLRHAGDGDDPPFAMDPSGFLAEPDGQNGGWRRPADAAESGGWVLLGEPGAGKTTAFEDLIPEADRESAPLPGEPGTLWLVGDELDSREAINERLGSYLDALPTKSDISTPVPDGLLVVIDQLDECLFLSQLAKWLTRKLRPRDTRGVRIWIACRTADYREAITDVLVRELGSCTVGDLAPLTQNDVAELISTTDVDAGRFLESVVRNGAGALASLPLTLKVLLNAFRSDSDSLRGTPALWLERGVTRLADEHAPDRISARPVDSTAEQRVAVAARIAAHLLLSGRRSVHTTVLGVDVADHAIPMGQMVGDNEAAGAGEFPVTKELVMETLATAIFTRTSPEKVAFAHSSFAAFLAARYLAARLTAPIPIPARQLEGVLLVSAADEDTAAIPEHLRETAAWLLAHAPAEARWLALADPEGLAAHSSVITAPEIRADIVDGLLARADRIELADRSWQRARWRLEHPGLCSQLSEVLSHADGSPSDDWPTFARVRLAVRLASESGVPELAEPLLRVAASTGWPVHVRQSAAKAALAVDASPAVVDRLRHLLQGLAPEAGTDSTNTQKVDRGPDSVSELIGTLLGLLWPEHLNFAEAAQHIDPGATISGFIGVYYFEVHRFPQSIPDEALDELVTFAEQSLQRDGLLLAKRDPDVAYEDLDEEELAELVPHLSKGHLTHERVRRLRDFVADVVERVLQSPKAMDLIDRTARMVLCFLNSAERMPLPSAVDLIDIVSGEEIVAARDLRRAFVEGMFKASGALEASDSPYWTYLIVNRWGRLRYDADRLAPQGTKRGRRRTLLDRADAEWASLRSLHHHAAGETRLADTLARVAEELAKPADELVEEPQTEVWKDAELFAAQQRERLDKAADGDAIAFVNLVYYLQLNPETGDYDPTGSWCRTMSSGATLWPAAELRQKLLAAAVHFLQAEQDHHEGWLGLRGSRRAEACMVAFATVHSDPAAREVPEDEQGLDVVPADRWKFWVGAIFDNLERFGRQEVELERELLARVEQHAHDELGTALAQYVRTRVVRGEQPVHLPELPLTFAPLLAELADEVGDALRTPDSGDVEDTGAEVAVIAEGPVVLEGEAARSMAVSSWANLLRLPLEVDYPSAIDQARSAIAEVGNEGDQPLLIDMAAAAGFALLTSNPAAHWPIVREFVGKSPAFAKDLAFRSADDSTRQPIISDLAEEELGEVYRWLSTVCPPETDVFERAAFVGREHKVHDWRRHIITELAQRGTKASVHVLRDLVGVYPDLLGIQSALHEARRRDQANRVGRLEPSEITDLLSHRARRVVNTAAQLAGVILDVLDEIQNDLFTHGNLLWDCERVDRPVGAKPNSPRPLAWRPKPEGTLGAYLTHELKQRLERRRVVVNREVVIRPTNEGDAGERPDIKLDVVGDAKHAIDGQAVTVPIEIKGAWHDDVLKAQADQLEMRYLRDLNTTDGVYVVAWYPISYWNVYAKEDARKSAANRHGSAEELEKYLLHQAAEIMQSTHRRTHPFVLVVERAVAAGDRIMRTPRPSRRSGSAGAAGSGA
ncbi:hypothetical protein AB0E59_05910 [Lentzea sp. NPDC034063]|uniref:NACHT domain-containing protein n=1 Tax=unclassified Lentzea TaxID=2643253 RepID=UPI0033D836A0